MHRLIVFFPAVLTVLWLTVILLFFPPEDRLEESAVGMITFAFLCLFIIWYRKACFYFSFDFIPGDSRYDRDEQQFMVTERLEDLRTAVRKAYVQILPTREILSMDEDEREEQLEKARVEFDRAVEEQDKAETWARRHGFSTNHHIARMKITPRSIQI